MGWKERVSLPIAGIVRKLQSHYAAKMFSSPKLMAVLNNHRTGVWGGGARGIRCCKALCIMGFSGNQLDARFSSLGDVVPSIRNKSAQLCREDIPSERK